jgi:hypothetical protein
MDFLSSASQFFSDNPSVLAMQIAMLALGTLVVFLVLYATRDIMIRTESFLVQVLCIVLVAGLPVVGFLLYMLVRPSTTVVERRMRHDMEVLLSKVGNIQQQKKQDKAQEKPKKA